MRQISIGCLLHAPNWGPGPQSRRVPWLKTELVTFHFAGWHSAHWATPIRVECDFLFSKYLPSAWKSNIIWSSPKLWDRVKKSYDSYFIEEETEAQRKVLVPTELFRDRAQFKLWTWWLQISSTCHYIRCPELSQYSLTHSLEGESVFHCVYAEHKGLNPITQFPSAVGLTDPEPLRLMYFCIHINNSYSICPLPKNHV